MKKSKHILKVLLIVSMFTVLLSGCYIRVPAEAPELSAELGKRISAMEKAHFAFISKYFSEKRQQIDEFIEKEWMPTFSKKVFGDSTVVAALSDTSKAEKDVEGKLRYITALGLNMQLQIKSLRDTLLIPINDLEIALKEKLHEEYELSKSINSSITSFLISARKVAKNRETLFSKIGIEESKIDSTLNQIDSFTLELLDYTNTAKDKIERYNEFKNKIENTIKNLKNK